jgi:hypothetical protein
MLHLSKKMFAGHIKALNGPYLALRPDVALESISPIFYARVFGTKCWCLKLQSCVLDLKFFGAKILYKKHAHKMMMKLTAVLFNIKLFSPDCARRSGNPSVSTNSIQDRKDSKSFELSSR